ncbi:MAG TPA: tRNA (adenosine(37)-N6)-threonylcarbamoyltransferase complex dimerization subunit type 1 TsaB [Acidimicrobiia bacterium]
MLLLCLDTATPQVGVAIGSDDQVIGRIQLARPAHHAEHLAPAIAYLLEQLDLSLDQLSGIGVGIGPGLFTGLRVGVTTAKVMAQALRIPLIAVPSLDLLAFEVRYTDRLVVPALDAKRGEVFYSTYRQVPGGVQRLSDYEVGAPADVCNELMAKGEEVLLIGDGALRYREDFYQLERAEFGPPSLSYPSVSALVELTRAKFQREDFSQPREVHPLYLRLSDAEMNWVKQAR